ncbi:hypothetical protein [Seleniivibrio woodruffii]|uniref:hypothetical protein n=1 Tax=Seleniivibrio woodruffii TaxID=1078050 RepID=UPI00240935AA|nr:hypothetical protein [Seleniivibrio woodruffii]
MSKQIIIKILALPFSILSFFFRVKNFRKRRILIFTDSRGIEVKKLINRQNPFSSYVGYFIRNYNVKYILMPEKHTTIVDFLYYASKTDLSKYDNIVLHLGVVDFSPRPVSMVKSIRYIKRNKFVSLFGAEIDEIDELRIDNGYIYNNDNVTKIYSVDFLKSYLIPKLQNFNGLICVGVNRVLEHWQGSYEKARPENMNDILEYDNILRSAIDKYVTLSDWSDDDIKFYTVDNIHYTADGFRFIKEEIIRLLELGNER